VGSWWLCHNSKRLGKSYCLNCYGLKEQKQTLKELGFDDQNDMGAGLVVMNCMIVDPNTK
jgi:hypothetical protein